MAIWYLIGFSSSRLLQLSAQQQQLNLSRHCSAILVLQMMPLIIHAWSVSWPSARKVYRIYTRKKQWDPVRAETPPWSKEQVATGGNGWQWSERCPWVQNITSRSFLHLGATRCDEMPRDATRESFWNVSVTSALHGSRCHESPTYPALELGTSRGSKISTIQQPWKQRPPRFPTCLKLENP